MILRRFNETGIAAFGDFLASCRDNPAAPIPQALLEDDTLTVVVTPQIEVTPRRFKIKADAAKYLNDLLSPLDDQDVAVDAGLWTWLTLFFFDEVCPAKNSRRSVKNDYSYIFEPKNSRHFYRHLLFIAWRIVKVAPAHNRLFLSGSVASLDKATSEVMKRLFITRIPHVFEALDRLYWDDKRSRIRPGVVSPGRVRPGDLMHRFPIRIRQLEMTYDLQSLSATKLIELLGDEFQQRTMATASSGR